MGISAATIRTWKEAALRPDTNAPVATHQLDQILAAAREAGLSEREQGVLLMSMTVGDLERKLTISGQADQVPMAKKLALAASMVLRMLENT